MPDRANGEYVSNADALVLWSPAAREVLLETSREGGRITEQQLAARVQDATGVRTRQPASEWIGRVLERVASDADSRGEPQLTSLCVRQQQTEAPKRRAASSGSKPASRAPARPAPQPALREVTCQACWMLVPVASHCRSCGEPLA